MTQGFTSNWVLSVSAIVFAWTISKETPNEQMRNSAKTTPHLREPSPLWI